MPGAQLVPRRHAELRRERPGAAVGLRRPGGPRGPRGRPGGADLEHDELVDLVARAAAGLRRIGVGRGDRVVGVLPNAEHALIAFLATASIGAVWSSCSPDFGASGVLDRFRQIEPTVLIAVDGYVYNGKPHDTLERLADAPRRAADAAGHRARALPRRGGDPRPAGPAGTSCSPSRPSRTTSACPSTPRCGSSTRPAPPACPSRSCRGTAASCSSTSSSCCCTPTSVPATASSGSAPPAG